MIRVSSVRSSALTAVLSASAVVGAGVFLSWNALALVGWYRPVALLLSGLLVGAIAFIMHHRSDDFRTSMRSWSRIDLLIVGVVLVFTLVIATGKHEYPQLRDDLSYLVGTTTLVEQGGLVYDDPYALPVHGVTSTVDGRSTSQFLPGYSVYLGVWEMVGDFDALRFANAALLAGTLLTLTALGKVLWNRQVGVPILVFSIASFAFNWFPQRFNSENLVQYFFWSAALLLALGVTQRSRALLALGALPMCCAILVRVEGIAYVATYVFLAWWISRTFPQGVVTRRWENTFRYGMPGIAVLLLAVYFTMIQRSYAIAQITQALKLAENWIVTVLLLLLLCAVGALVVLSARRLPSVRRFITTPRTYVWLSAAFLGLWVFTGLAATFRDELPRQAFKSLYAMYALQGFGYLILIALSALVALRANRRIAAVFLLTIPSYAFLIEPFIALDLPWFLRRYATVIIPAAILFGSIALVFLIRSMLLRLTVVGLLTLVLLQSSIPVLGYREHSGVNAQLATLASRWPAGRDLVLFDPSVQERRWAIGLHFFYDVDAIHAPAALPRDTLQELADDHERVVLVFDASRRDTPTFVTCDADALITLQYPELTQTNRITGSFRTRTELTMPYLEALFAEQNAAPVVETINRSYQACTIRDWQAYTAELSIQS